MMGQALVVACIGYLLCFLVLGVIWGVLSIMKYFMVPNEKSEVKQNQMVTQAVVEDTKADQDDDELIAVLTAAVAASLNTSTYNLKIKSFKRLSSCSSRWGVAAVNDNLLNKLQ